MKGVAAAGVALVLIGTVAWALNKPPTADCSDQASADHQVHTIRATKVVVQPWLGQHHVYGIFIVPNQYKQNNTYALTITVQGSDHFFAIIERPHKELADDVFAKPGNYFLSGYLPTRVALWFLVNGLFGDLRRPCNWTLVVIDRSS